MPRFNNYKELPHCYNHNKNYEDCLFCDYAIINNLELLNTPYNNFTGIEYIMRSNIEGKSMTISKNNKFGNKDYNIKSREILLKHQGIVLAEEEEYFHKYLFVDDFKRRHSKLINILGGFEKISKTYSIEFDDSDIPYYSIDNNLLSLIEIEELVNKIRYNIEDNCPKEDMLQVSKKFSDDLCDILFPSLTLRDDNERLKKRVAMLECAPYRGPEFFKMLNEEITQGVAIQN